MRSRSILAFVSVAALVFASPAFAGGNSNNSPTTNNDNRDYSVTTNDNRTTNNFDFSATDNRSYDNRVTNNDNRVTNNLDLSDNRVTNNDNRDYSTNNQSSATGGAATGGSAVAGGGTGIGGGATIGNVTTGPATATNTNNAGDVDVRNTNTALGGAVNASGNSANNNDLDVTSNNLLGQQQGIADSGNSSSHSGVTDSGNSIVGVGVDVAGNNAALTNNAGDVNVTIGGNTYEAPKIPVPSAYAAPSVVGGGVCAYTPFSAGVQVLKFGGSAQGAIIDQGCEDRANADVLARLGLRDEAMALLMKNERVKTAFAAAETIRANRALAEAQANKTAAVATGGNSTVTHGVGTVAYSGASDSTKAVQDQKVGNIVEQGFIDPKKGYRIIAQNAKPE